MRCFSLVLAAAAACACAMPSDGPAPSCDPDCEAIADAPSHTLRTRALDRLRELSSSTATLFGQQVFNVNGVAPSPWKATPGQVSRSDVFDLTGQHPAVLGLDAWNLIKPASWSPGPAVHAEAARYVAERGGLVTLSWHMRGCDQSEEGAEFYRDGNQGCLCRLVNDESYARRWLLEDKLARFADAILMHDLDDVPLVLRPFHEHSGDWFWWGRAEWSCPGQPVSGEDAYVRLVRMTVDYLRVERGLDNLLIAYSPDRLTPEGPTDPSSARDRYLRGYPGDAYVDVMGIDLYYRDGDDHDELTREFSEYTRVVSNLAQERHKAAALTEVGNLGLHGEIAAGRSDSWYQRQLLDLLGDSRTRLAYLLTWDNRTVEPGKYFVPTGDHPGTADFRSFHLDPDTLFLGDFDLYAETDDLPYPTCSSCGTDDDGDGWGWELGASCLVPSWCMERGYYPTCRSCESDSDGDGWGFESRSCRVPPEC